MKKTFKEHPNYYMVEDEVYKDSHEKNGRSYRAFKLRKTYRNRTETFKGTEGYYLDGKFYSLKKLKNIAICHEATSID